jgi:uncharacterized membrane protein
MSTSEHRHTPHGVDTARILAFSDGVFAIAITLLILELKVPHVESGLLRALADEWPSYLSFVMSFVVIGVIWAQHHHVYASLIARADHVFVLINVLFLMWVAFLPFPTGVVAEHLDNPRTAQTAMAFYAGTFVAGALIYQVFWRYARHGHRLLAADADPAAVAVVDRSYAVGVPLYLLDFGLAFVNVTASLIVFMLVAVLYAVAPLMGRVPAVGSPG